MLSGELRERHVTLQWLFWQVGGLGPMLGQNHHFNYHAPQPIPYAIERYQVETQRLNCRTTISPKTILRTRQEHPGAATETCYLPTGSTITSIRSRHMICAT
jgi:hypothetical protein